VTIATLLHCTKFFVMDGRNSFDSTWQSGELLPILLTSPARCDLAVLPCAVAETFRTRVPCRVMVLGDQLCGCLRITRCNQLKMELAIRGKVLPETIRVAGRSQYALSIASASAVGGPLQYIILWVNSSSRV